MDPDPNDKIIEGLYEAALDPDSWHVALRDLAQACDAERFHFMAWPVGAPSPASSLSWGIDPAVEASYVLHYGRVDPRRPVVDRRPDGYWLACHLEFDKRSVGRSEFYQDYLIPNDFRYMLGGRVVCCGGIEVLYGLHRGPGQRPFDDAPVALLQRLTGHFQRAGRLWLRTEDLREQAARGTASLDLLEQGVIALDHAGRVRHANRIAEALLREGYELRVRAGKVCAATAADARPLVDAVKACFADRRPRSLRIGRLNLTLVPLARSGPLADALGATHLVLLIGAEARLRKATSSQLIQTFGFTAAEARVAQAIAVGDTPSDYAGSRALSLNTVKTHLKSVFAKTGCRRQSDLARLLAAVPPARDVSGHSNSA